MRTLNVATASGLHLLGDGHRLELEGRDVTALYIGSDAERWAIVDRSELWHDPGSGWESKATSGDLQLNCLLVNDGKAWVGTSRARLMQFDGSTLRPVASFDEAPGRAEWFTPWGGPPDVRSLTVQPERLFVNVHVGGILRSSRDGAAFEPTIDIGADVHEVAPAGHAGVVAATAWGLAVSDDLGQTWTFDDDGLHATYARAIAVGEESLFMTACEGPFGGRSAIYRRPLDGSGLSKCGDGLPEWFQDNIDTGCVSAADGLVAFGAPDGRVFLSSDDGNSWDEIATDLGTVRWVEFGSLD